MANDTLGGLSLGGHLGDVVRA